MSPLPACAPSGCKYRQESQRLLLDFVNNVIFNWGRIDEKDTSRDREDGNDDGVGSVPSPPG